MERGENNLQFCWRTKDSYCRCDSEEWVIGLTSSCDPVILRSCERRSQILLVNYEDKLLLIKHVLTQMWKGLEWNVGARGLLSLSIPCCSFIWSSGQTGGGMEVLDDIVVEYSSKKSLFFPHWDLQILILTSLTRISVELKWLSIDFCLWDVSFWGYFLEGLSSS